MDYGYTLVLHTCIATRHPFYNFYYVLDCIFEHIQASALIYMQDNHGIKLLYQFLSKASVVFDEVYPHM